MDATPTQATAEARVIANYVNGVISVIMAKRSPREAFKRSVESLEKEKRLYPNFSTAIAQP